MARKVLRVAVGVTLILPGAAVAAAPTLLSAEATPERHLTATWSLPPNGESQWVRASTSNVPDENFGFQGGGYGWNSFGSPPHFSKTDTSFTSPTPLDPGTYYIRVGAYDPADPPSTRWSNILSVAIASQCADGADNDGDGKVDQAADPGCLSAEDDDETDPPPPPEPSGPTSVAVSVRRVDGILAVRARGVQAGLACPMACKANATLLLAGKAAKKVGLAAAIVVGRGSTQLTTAGHGTFAIKLTKKAKKKLKDARSVKLTLQMAITGADGGALGSFKRKVKLVRQTPTNQAPAFPTPMSASRETTYRYDEQGRLMGGYTKITLDTPPTDPDGDPLTYTWTASRGDIKFTGPSAVWTRIVDLGQLGAGMVTVTVSDGRGGSDSFTFDFQRGAG